MAKFGTKSPAQNSSVVQKMKDTNVAKFGVEWSAASPDVRKQIKATTIERYGVDNAAKAPEVLDRMRQTTLDHHGVEWPCMIATTQQASHTPDAIAKGIMTKVANGGMTSSSQEDRLHRVLVEASYQVTRWVMINGWSIDLRVDATNQFYVQVDGIRWHGLDRPLHEVLSDESEQGRAIARKYHRDIEQNAWFASHNVTLIRITDVEIDGLTDEQLLSLIHTHSLSLGKLLDSYDFGNVSSGATSLAP
jgi:hypothetical protein